MGTDIFVLILFITNHIVTPMIKEVQYLFIYLQLHKPDVCLDPQNLFLLLQLHTESI